tara:strand:+ start:254 stop:493 length:240 start_codon:yes stop_codon:yes gene_type:complete
MKKLLLLFVVSFPITGLTQLTENFMEMNISEINLKGKVKSITQSKYKTKEKFGEIKKKSLVTKWVLKQDENGNKTEQAN